MATLSDNATQFAATRYAGSRVRVDEVAPATKPNREKWCDGSDAEWNPLTTLLVTCGTKKPVNAQKCPRTFVAATDPRDVARVERWTFICSEPNEDAAPADDCAAPAEMKSTLKKLFDGCRGGRQPQSGPDWGSHAG